MIGLTGNIACGKSRVLRELGRLGAATLDADAVAHRVMRPGLPAHAAIVEAFGPAVLGSDGEIDRPALGQIVFRDAAALGRLEAIVHPAVLAYILDWLQRVDVAVAVIDAIKLIEAGIADRCDEVWVVTCPREEQLRRLMEYRGMGRQEALMRIHAQPPQEEKVRHADVVIDNGGEWKNAREQVRAAWQDVLLRRAAATGEGMATDQ
jgi:dephospho-CoA kinase